MGNTNETASAKDEPPSCPGGSERPETTDTDRSIAGAVDRHSPGRERSSEGEDKRNAQAKQGGSGGRERNDNTDTGDIHHRRDSAGNDGGDSECLEGRDGSRDRQGTTPPMPPKDAAKARLSVPNNQQGIKGDYPGQQTMAPHFQTHPQPPRPPPPRPLLDQQQRYQTKQQRYGNQSRYQNPPPQYQNPSQYQNPPPLYGNQQPPYKSPPTNVNNQLYQIPPPQYGQPEQFYPNPPPKHGSQQQPYHLPPPHYGTQQQPYQYPQPQFGNQNPPFQNRTQEPGHPHQQQRFRNPPPKYKNQQPNYTPAQLLENQQPYQNPPPHYGNQQQTYRNQTQQHGNRNQRFKNPRQQHGNPQHGNHHQRPHQNEKQCDQSHQQSLQRNRSNLTVNDDSHNLPSRRGKMTADGKKSKSVMDISKLEQEEKPGGKSSKQKRYVKDGEERNNPQGEVPPNYHRAKSNESEKSQRKMEKSYSLRDVTTADDDERPFSKRGKCYPDRNRTHGNDRGGSGRNVCGHMGDNNAPKRGRGRINQGRNFDGDGGRQSYGDKSHIQGHKGTRGTGKPRNSNKEDTSSSNEDDVAAYAEVNTSDKADDAAYTSYEQRSRGKQGRVNLEVSTLKKASRDVEMSDNDEDSNEENTYEEEETVTSDSNETPSSNDDDDDTDLDDWEKNKEHAVKRLECLDIDDSVDADFTVNESSNLNNPQEREQRTKKNDKKGFSVDENRKRRPSSRISEPAVFDFLVKHMNGQCSPKELKNNSELFGKDVDIEKWLEESHRTLSVIRRDGKIVSVIAYMTGITYCLDYTKRRPCQSNCGRYHICKDFLNGYCHFSGQCKFSHDFLDKRNMELSRTYRLGSYTNEEMTSIMRVRFPKLCNEWIKNSTCGLKNCTALHMCRMFIIGKCTNGGGCTHCHDRNSPHNKSIVEALSMTSYSQSVFRNMVYVVRDQIRDNPDTSSRHRRELGADVAINPMSIDSEDPPNICDNNLSGKCDRSNCYNHHNTQRKLPYIWQIKPDDQWLSLEESESIEKAYCDLDTKSAIFNLPGNADFTFCVRFETNIHACVSMDFEGEREQQVEARRISTESYGNDTVAMKNFKTQWRWFHRNYDRDWAYFTSETTNTGVSTPDNIQFTLERKFLHGQKEYFYSRDGSKYCLSFEHMKLQNLDIGTTADLMRRPLMVTQEMVASQKYPPLMDKRRNVETILPTLWAPWDLVQPFELVRLREDQTEYTSVSIKFHTTLKAERFPICDVFRVQNHELWEMYQMKLKKMKEKMGPELDTRQLFHGTGDLNAVSGICTNNIDPNVSGKNANAYGQGSYFARSAKYSHAYTDLDRDRKRRYMFLVDVIVGEYTTGHKDYRRPPPKPGSADLLYDACVDKMENPSIFVVFDKPQFYPSYLIMYRCADDDRA